MTPRGRETRWCCCRSRETPTSSSPSASRVPHAPPPRATTTPSPLPPQPPQSPPRCPTRLWVCDRRLLTALAARAQVARRVGRRQAVHAARLLRVLLRPEAERGLRRAAAGRRPFSLLPSPPLDSPRPSARSAPRSPPPLPSPPPRSASTRRRPGTAPRTSACARCCSARAACCQAPRRLDASRTPPRHLLAAPTGALARATLTPLAPSGRAVRLHLRLLQRASPAAPATAATAAYRRGGVQAAHRRLWLRGGRLQALPVQLHRTRPTPSRAAT